MIVSRAFLYFITNFTQTTNWLLCKIARIPMVVVKWHKLYMFYSIFMALYYVLLSGCQYSLLKSVGKFHVDAFHFTETNQLIFFCSYDARMSFKNLLCLYAFWKLFAYMDTFLCKISSRGIWPCSIMALLRFYFNLLFPMVQFY